MKFDWMDIVRIVTGGLIIGVTVMGIALVIKKNHMLFIYILCGFVGAFCGYKIGEFVFPKKIKP